MIADYHVHTEFSDDSIYPMEQVVKDAIEQGIDEICFTDHIDYGIKADHDEEPFRFEQGIPLTNVDYPRYVESVLSLKEKYANQITIRLGLEFGLQKNEIERYNRLFERYPFDFILLSVHAIDNQGFWNREYQQGKTQDEIEQGYYQALYEMTKQFDNYSVLAHLDLICRYDPYGEYPFEKIEPIVTKILQTVIEKGKGIEFNTSNTRYGLKDTTPSRDILRLYKKLGGTIITIGSDSHKPEHFKAGLEEAKKILREEGFDSFCTFEQMRPVFHAL